jgi:DNA-binding response OmpR family regulator
VKILIGDADPEITKDVQMVLNTCQPGWQLSIIDSGRQCLDILKNGSCPDVVILGIELADMSGLDLVEKIRDDSGVPIVILSHDKEIATLVKAFEAGANDYVLKPFNKQIFIARLKALVRRRMWNTQEKENRVKEGNKTRCDSVPCRGKSGR